MIHHQHYFPVVDEHGKLKPAFLAVTNVEVERPELISLQLGTRADGLGCTTRSSSSPPTGK